MNGVKISRKCVCHYSSETEKSKTLEHHSLFCIFVHDAEANILQSSIRSSFFLLAF